MTMGILKSFSVLISCIAVVLAWLHKKTPGRPREIILQKCLHLWSLNLLLIRIEFCKPTSCLNRIIRFFTSHSCQTITRIARFYRGLFSFSTWDTGEKSMAARNARFACAMTLLTISAIDATTLRINFWWLHIDAEDFSSWSCMTRA